MHYQIRERELALQISKSREQFYWLSAFYTVSMIGMIYRCVFLFALTITILKLNLINVCFSECRYRITKRSNNLIPIVPFTFTIAYVADLAYGSKQHRIRGLWLFQTFYSFKLYNWHNVISFPFDLCLAEAEMIMQNESDLLEWPHGLPSVSSIDQARFDTEIEKKLHPVTP